MINKKPHNNRRKHRPTGRRNNFSRNNDFESNNHYKPKGSAAKVLERYLNLAQDANSNGDRIKAEGFYQYAEHYQRIINSNNVTKENVDKVNSNDGNKLKVDLVDDESNKPKDSRTQRSLNGKTNRLNKDKDIESHDIQKPPPSVEVSKEDATSDGVEALKAFSTSIDEIK